jgi:hypothetical protein
MDTVWIVFIILLLCLTIYIVVYVIYPGSGNEELVPKMLSLGEKKNIMMPDRVQSDILGSSGSSVMGFFYLRQGDRTLRYGTADQYVPLIQVENNWYLEISPAPKEKTEHGARLRIQTQKNGQTAYETIELPVIPKQKWMYLAILREGRRVDVLYNDQLVASQRLIHYPVVIPSPLSVGNKGLEGTVVHVKVNPTRLSPHEAERERLAHVDTNGMLLEAKWNPFHKNNAPTMPALALTAECPPGMPCSSTIRPPKKNLYAWKTPYA